MPPRVAAVGAAAVDVVAAAPVEAADAAAGSRRPRAAVAAAPDLEEALQWHGREAGAALGAA
jgi:hypothetical protein